jgi:phosphoenolpyruvate carboxylase
MNSHFGGLAQPRHDLSRHEVSLLVHFLGDLLGGVIRELEPPEFFLLEEEIRLRCIRRREERGAASGMNSHFGGLAQPNLRALASAFAVYFDLINVAEDSARVGALREREARQGSRWDAGMSMRRMIPFPFICYQFQLFGIFNSRRRQ